MALADEEDHFEFLEKRGVTKYFDSDGSTIIFKVTSRGKSKELEITNEEIEAIQRIGKIVHIAVIGQEEEKTKPYINIEVVRQKELDLRQPSKEKEKEEKKGEEEHPEHISD
jgi:hypothetical protein